MATWITHLRIAEKLLYKIKGISPVEFIVGSMAPDSGVPKDDGTDFVPNTEISHRRRIDPDGVRRIHVEEYAEKYFGAKARENYDKASFSFHLGYLAHLYTDIYWANLARERVDMLSKAFPERDKDDCKQALRRDWLDLDFLYLGENGLFEAFRLYRDAKGFQNRFLDFFSEDAFDRRREYITHHYLSGKDGVRREYLYFNSGDMEAFVKESVEKITRKLTREYGVPVLA